MDKLLPARTMQESSKHLQVLISEKKHGQKRERQTRGKGDSHFRCTFALASKSDSTTSLLRSLIAVWRTVSDSQNLLGSALELIIKRMIS
jgi:hypothetical protein